MLFCTFGIYIIKSDGWQIRNDPTNKSLNADPKSDAVNSSASSKCTEVYMETIFSKPNIIYWAILSLIILVETRLLTSTKPPYQKSWPGPKRWWLGWLTLFGSSLVMVIFQGWHLWTWLGLAVATALVRQLKPHALLGNLWRRKIGSTSAGPWAISWRSSCVFQ